MKIKNNEINSNCELENQPLVSNTRKPYKPQFNVKSKKFYFLLFTATILIVLWLLFDRGYLRFNYPSRTKYNIWGIDVSHHQGKIDWYKVKRDNVQFVYIKATEGGDFKDSSFIKNWNGAKKEGIKVGAYHFFTFCRPVKEQINNFISTVPVQDDALPPALDLEFLGNCKKSQVRVSFPEDIYVFINALRSRFGKEPVLYVTYEFYEAHLKSLPLGQNPIWIRSIFVVPAKDPKWTIWQYANHGRIQGIETPVDLNVYNYDQIYSPIFSKHFGINLATSPRL